MDLLSIDNSYLLDLLTRLLNIHSPTGYTDPIVREVCGELEQLGVEYELTRRGAIRATILGRDSNNCRAAVSHVDTIGAMVKMLKSNGRLAVVPVGTWSSRFAEGARVSVFTDDTIYRGTILPLKASGHVFNHDVDTQPVSWENLEIRIDEPVRSKSDLKQMGFNVGDFVGVDSQPEILTNGFINARHLDNKAGVAGMLAVMRSIIKNGLELPTDIHFLFTISEEVGSGASAVLHGRVSEMVTIDNGTSAPGQMSREFGVTIAMADSAGPFDYHLTHRLIHLCQNQNIPYVRDIFRYYRCDSASALEAGNDLRTALITFGLDSSHGYERTNLNSLDCVSKLLLAYCLSEPLYREQAKPLSTLADFPKTRKVDVGEPRRGNQEFIAQVSRDDEEEEEQSHQEQDTLGNRSVDDGDDR